MPLGLDQHHFKILHTRIIEFMNTPTSRRGSYNLSYKGICLGITSMAIQAILLNKTEYIKFCERIKLLCRFLFDTKSKCFLNEEEQIDLHIFLEGVALYQEPYKYRKLIFEDKKIINYKVQDYHSLIFRMIKPLAFDIQKKNIYKFPNLLGCYYLTEIELFLNTLKKAIHKVIIGENIAFMLHIHNHIIALRYDHDNTSWTLIDANMLNIVDQLYLSNSMASLLVESFVNYDQSSSNIKLAIATDPIITINESDDISMPIEIKDRFILELQSDEDWQKIHQITKDKLDRTNDGASWLYIAARNGQLEMVKQLILAKADVNLAKDSGITPLWVTVQEGRTEITKILLEANAEVDIINLTTGTTPLVIASQNGCDAIVSLLIQFKANVNKYNYTGITPLLAASQNGYLNIVNMLIAANANINTSNYDGITPLWIAVKNKHFPVIEFLLKQGGDLVNPKENYKTLPSTIIEDDVIGNNRLVIFDGYDELDGFFDGQNNSNNLNIDDDNKEKNKKINYKYRC